MNVQKVVDALEQERGLCRGVLQQSNGSYRCAIGALLFRAEGKVSTIISVQDAILILKAAYDIDSGEVSEIVEINDEFEGTGRKRHVINKIKEEYGD